MATRRGAYAEATRRTGDPAGGSGTHRLGGETGSSAKVSTVPRETAIVEALARAGDRGIVPRGLGRSGGDAARNAGGCALVLIGALASARSVHVDWLSKTARVPAGADLNHLVPELLRHGWFLPVTPDTTHATVGGCIATDVHGRNHRSAGSLGNRVRALDVIDAAGTMRTLAPDDATAPQFWATVGGMGLTGVITSAILDVIPVSSTWMSVDTTRCGDLDDVMRTVDAACEVSPYVIARLDTTAQAGATGRGVVTAARHASATDLPIARQQSALEFDASPPPGAILATPRRLLSRWALRAYNRAWYATAPRNRRGELVQFANYFYKHDQLSSHDMPAPPVSVIQYQFAVPDGSTDVLRSALDALSAAGAPALRASLRRLGPANPAPLSFATQGWALDLEVAITGSQVALALNTIDEQVASCGGRIFLATDARMRPELLGAMYPRLDEWRHQRATADPDRRLMSDMARRLGL